jgi:hypothetical protein
VVLSRNDQGVAREQWAHVEEREHVVFVQDDVGAEVSSDDPTKYALHVCHDARVTDHPVNLSSGLPETVLPPQPSEALAALDAAVGDRDAVSAVAARWPTFLDAWARLSELARDDVEAYADARVGYHRGLDALRAAGWRGSGYVRWREPSNQGFLRALDQLRRSAAAIGETAEEERCALFLQQLDPGHFS